MTCPRSQDWDLLATDALEDERAAPLLAHARQCPACREVYAAARRDHIDRVRMYEAFDRDHDEQREQLLAALPADAPRHAVPGALARGWYRLGDYTMSLTKTTGRRAVALLVPIAAAVFLALFLLPTSSKSSAFAAALQHLREARSFICRISMPDGVEMQGMKLQPEGSLQFSDEFGSRSEMRVNDTVITQSYAPVRGPMTIVQPITKTWLVLDVSQAAMLDVDEQSPDAFVRALRKLTDSGATELGEETIDGRTAIGYRVEGEKLGFPRPKQPGVEPAYSELWVDTQTQLPARLVLSMPMPEEGKRLKMVYDHFEWNAPLEPGLFQPNIPADYVQVEAQLARPSEAALLNALRQIADWTGSYPASIAPTAVLGRLHTMIRDEKRTDFDALGRAGMMRLGIEIGGGTMYYMKLIRDGRQPEYFGDEVTPADTGKVLLRWKLDDGQMRVVYSDLRVETVPAE